MLKNTMFFATCASLVAVSFVTTQTQLGPQAQSALLVPASGSSSYESQITPLLETNVQALSPTYTKAAYQLSAIGSGSTSSPSHIAEVQAVGADVNVSPKTVQVTPPSPAIPFPSVAPPAPAPTVTATYPPIITYQPTATHPPAITYPPLAIYPPAPIYTPAVVHPPAASYPPFMWPTQPNCFPSG